MRGAMLLRDARTLQKSMDFTPLLPSAGPTGGDGDACPAPTISFTIWSFCSTFLAIALLPNRADELPAREVENARDGPEVV